MSDDLVARLRLLAGKYKYEDAVAMREAAYRLEELEARMIGLEAMLMDGNEREQRLEAALREILQNLDNRNPYWDRGAALYRGRRALGGHTREPSGHIGEDLHRH